MLVLICAIKRDIKYIIDDDDVSGVAIVIIDDCVELVLYYNKEMNDVEVMAVRTLVVSYFKLYLTFTKSYFPSESSKPTPKEMTDLYERLDKDMI